MRKLVIAFALLLATSSVALFLVLENTGHQSKGAAIKNPYFPFSVELQVRDK